MKQKILALCGGVGGAKLAYGLSQIITPEEIVFLVNTGDDFIHLDLYISPDLDTVMYTLAGVNDPNKGWGVKEETWNALGSLKKYGLDTWFQLGDKDLATHIRRTQLLKKGLKLSEVTRNLSSQLGLKHNILPMSESPVQTMIQTDQGKLSFQEYFVKHKCDPKIEKIKFLRSEVAEIPTSLEEQIKDDKFTGVIICPSNPYLSVDPILSINKIRTFLLETKIPILAVSPIIDNDSIKGPTAKIMDEMKIKPSVNAIAAHYSELINILVIDQKDKDNQANISSIDYLVDSIYMKNNEDKVSLAKVCLEELRKLS
jgi:LPPG:FO 2-phospho-L-lactate transferase